MTRRSLANLVIRIDLGPHGHVGPGKIELLEKIDELGSISAAARAMRMSYRQAWTLIDQLNGAFKRPVVTSQTGGRRGGGAKLTPDGRAVLAQYRAIAEKALAGASEHLVAIETALRRRPRCG